jgi:ATP-dependent Clp protease ATP-binding subunit ClpA
MMFERFTPDARAVVAHAGQHARRLGHRYVGGEHILLAAVSAGQPASAVLCAHGVTPERVEEEIVRRVGLGAGAGLFGGVDADALASIGIDLDAVRARIEASFGPRALANAAQTLHQAARGSRVSRRRWPPSWVRHALRRRTRRTRPGMTGAAASSPSPMEAAGRVQGPGQLPFTPAAKKILQLTFREALAVHDSHIGVEHIGLALTSVKRGLVPVILTATGASAPALRAGILNRYRQAS